LFKEAAKLRGHMCVGIPLGVRMGLRGLELLDLTDPQDRHDLMVVVETNNCTVDGIQITTGCSAGSRRLRVLDYGKSAATFYDGRTGKGYRVATRPEFLRQAVELGVRDGIVAKGQPVEEFSSLEREITMNAFLRMPKDELLDCKEVEVTPKSFLKRGKHTRVVCAKCGEVVRDGKGVAIDNRVICASCSNGAYYVMI